MIKEIAIADAYGAGFEFSSRLKIASGNTADRYFEHELSGMSAKYTDDTQMSIAIAELILAEPVWTDRIIASKFVDCFKRDPRRGYSKGLYGLLSAANDGEELLQMLVNISDRNGAAMRSVPLGVIKDRNELICKAKMQASITHNTDIAIASSCSVALAAHFGIHEKGHIEELKRFLEKEGFSGWNYSWFEEVSVRAFDTVSAALSCLMVCDSLKDLLIKCVSLGGDTDSVSAIAVGIASCFDEYDKELPIALINSLDEPVFGIEFFDELDEKLFEYALR